MNSGHINRIAERMEDQAAILERGAPADPHKLRGMARSLRDLAALSDEAAPLGGKAGDDVRPHERCELSGCRHPDANGGECEAWRCKISPDRPQRAPEGFARTGLEKIDAAISHCVATGAALVSLSFDDAGDVLGELTALRRLAQQPADQRQEGECGTCNGHGMIGGFVSADSGYESAPCPDCASPPPEAASPVGEDDGWAQALRISFAGQEWMARAIDAERKLAALASPTVAPVSGDGESLVNDYEAAIMARCRHDDPNNEEPRTGHPRRDELNARAALLAALASPTGVDESMVERYVNAVDAHLGSLTTKQWEIERFDHAASVRRVARIGLTAALAARDGGADRG